MSGRYVILEFDDRDAATVFIEREEVLSQLGASVVSMHLRPDSVCECPDRQRQDGRNWARGRRSGIFLCKQCRKPSRFHTSGLLERLKYAMGYDLREGVE